MMHVLLPTLGSAGDVNPFIGLGIALHKRGHRVTVITNERFERQVRAAHLEFARMGTHDQYERLTTHRDTWDERHSLDPYFELATEVMPEGYAAIARLYEPGRTVVAALHAAFAARIAHSTLRVPLATVAVVTPVLYSRVDTPVVRATVDESDLLRRINAFRRTLGLLPLQELGRWVTSPQLVLALWPEWFYAPQPDWPPNVVTTGFVEYDGADGNATGTGPDEHRLFPDGPGIVFTAGTGNAQAEDFFATSARVAQQLGRAGLLVTSYAEQIPHVLPSGVSHLAYAPFRRLFPRAAAVVHHGGIGVSARALRAGVPQLVVPLVNDQFDNARRLCRLGVARCLSRRSFTVEAASAALCALLASPSVAESCRRQAAAFPPTDDLEATCRLLETLSRAA